MQDTLKQEFTRRISMANSTELIVILYDMVLAYSDDAEEALKEDRDHDFYASISRMRNCVNELMCSLHMEYEPAGALLSLYRYCMSHNYKMVYTPELHVLHKEDSSTSSMFNSDRKKREFVFKNMIKSLKVYRKYV